MNLNRIIYYLSQVETRGLDDKTEQRTRDSLAQLKVNVVKAGNQEFAKELWCYGEILDIQTKYLKAFNQMKNGAFYEGWCTLERVEIGVNSLEKHFDITAKNDGYKILFIKTQTERFQSLFPYKYFISPGVLHIEKRCSICNTALSLRNHCGHIPGEIYDGEMCVREITQAEMLELSLVTKPVQKYSVMFLSNQDDSNQGDGYDYGLVEYVIRGLREPFHGWEAHRTQRRHPHSKFKKVGRNDMCPCESGKKYKLCCLREEGVLCPHVDIIFELAPPKDLPKIEYTY
jgi:hypothetical protein